MNILQIPIVDEFHNPRLTKRDVEFASEKGLLSQNPRRPSPPTPIPSVSSLPTPPFGDMQLPRTGVALN